jgi:hypothetical protein
MVYDKMKTKHRNRSRIDPQENTSIFRHIFSYGGYLINIGFLWIMDVKTER